LNIYVGNLSFNTTERQLEEAFASYGAVQSARIATDRDTNRPRGFGFVEMGDATEAQNAIAGLNGKELDGRTLTVNEARPREDRGPRGGGGGGNRGGYGGGGGGYGGGGGGGYAGSRGRY
jgi:RNA recognition motif-containing protein